MPFIWEPLPASLKGKEGASPPPLSEWNNPTQPPPRGGVPNGSESEKVSLIQRGRFFTSKRRPFHGKETPSSIERRRFFHFKILLPLYLSGIGVHVNGSIHATLHSERGKGVRLQSRDRRPRLSAHLPLYGIPLGNIPSFGGAWGGFYLP